MFPAEPGQPDQLVAFGFGRGFLFLQVLLLAVQVFFPSDQSFQLLVDQRFPIGQSLFEVREFAAACAEGFFRLLAELQSLFAGGEARFAQNGLGFPASIFQKRFPFRGLDGVESALFPMVKPITQQDACEEKQGAFPIDLCQQHHFQTASWPARNQRVGVKM